MKISLDFEKSAKQIPPAGVAQLKFKKQEMKTTAKQPPRPMLQIQWNVASMEGIPSNLYERALIFDHLMLTEDMLWKLRQLMAACGKNCLCTKCQTEYPSDPNEGGGTGNCPNCGSFQFDVDTDFLETSNPMAQIQPDQDDKGQPTCKLVAYIKQ